jgi:aspartokinase
MISTSEIKISVIIKLDDGEKGTKAVHQAFLGQ